MNTDSPQRCIRFVRDGLLFAIAWDGRSESLPCSGEAVSSETDAKICATLLVADATLRVRTPLGSGPGWRTSVVVCTPIPPGPGSVIHGFGETWQVDELGPPHLEMVTLRSASLTLHDVDWALFCWLDDRTKVACEGRALERLYRSTIRLDGQRVAESDLTSSSVAAAQCVSVGERFVKGGMSTAKPLDRKSEREFWARLGATAVGLRHLDPEHEIAALGARQKSAEIAQAIGRIAPAFDPHAVVRGANRDLVAFAVEAPPRHALDGFGRKRGPAWDRYQRFLAGALDAANDRPVPLLLPGDLAERVGLFDYPPALFLLANSTPPTAPSKGIDIDRARADIVLAAAKRESGAVRARDAGYRPIGDPWSVATYSREGDSPCDRVAYATLGRGRHRIAPICLDAGQRGNLDAVSLQVRPRHGATFQPGARVGLLADGSLVRLWVAQAGEMKSQAWSRGSQLLRPGELYELEITSTDEAVLVDIEINWHELLAAAVSPKVPAAERRSVSLEPERSQALLPPHREKPIRIMRLQIAGSGSDRGIPNVVDRAQVVLACDGTNMGAWRATVGGVFESDDESLAGVVIGPFQKLTVTLVRARSGPTPPVEVTLDWEEV